MENLQVHELRIGNLLHDNKDRLCQVEEIFKHKFKAPAIFGAITSLPNKPIPLTEEWLVSFGLIKDNGYPYKFLSGFIKIRNGIHFYKYYDLDIELKHVHTLQNLYFALTNQELKII